MVPSDCLPSEFRQNTGYRRECVPFLLALGRGESFSHCTHNVFFFLVSLVPGLATRGTVCGSSNVIVAAAPTSSKWLCDISPYVKTADNSQLIYQF
jgi:hypothetical protein